MASSKVMESSRLRLPTTACMDVSAAPTCPLSLPTLCISNFILVGDDSNRGKLTRSTPSIWRVRVEKFWSTECEGAKLSMFNNDGSAGVAGNRRTPPRRGTLLCLAVTNTALEKCRRRVLGRTPAAATTAAGGLLGTREILAGLNWYVVFG